MAMAPAATIAHRGSRQWQARVRREAYPPLEEKRAGHWSACWRADELLRTPIAEPSVD